ncbi:MAG: ATP-binding cassette domain-containing protein [Treponema sp.]|nr:ATP-binding cassette domain-containing protein [Treponema sp.]
MLILNNLSFAYDSKPIFKDLSLNLSRGWTALSGANGSGKSTLIHLISGVLSPDSGAIYSEGSIVVCPQTSDEAPGCFSDPEILNSRDFYTLLEKLGIETDWIDRWDTLSGGEKKRCLIADTLVRKPAVLLLDEPANHIDQRTMDYLLAALKLFEGIGIVVSHNMAFLDALARETLLLIAKSDAPSLVFQIAMPPLKALASFEQEQEGKRKLKAGLSEEVKRISQAKSEAVRDAADKKRKLMSKKHVSRHDSDARGKINLARLTGKDKRGGQKVTAFETALDRKKASLENNDALGLRKSGAGLRGSKSKRPILYFLEQGDIDFGFYSINHPDLSIKNDSRIIISGPNGSGKTSLLNYILGSMNKDGLKHWYLPQELSLQDVHAAHRELQSLNEKDKGAVLSVIYRLGSEPSAFFNVHDISPGEARKLCFALAMLQGVSLILLDEPTNHMDAVSAMSFADAIREFAGAVVIITHDTAFAEKVGEVVWELRRKGSAGRLVVDSKAQ